MRKRRRRRFTKAGAHAVFFFCEGAGMLAAFRRLASACYWHTGLSAKNVHANERGVRMLGAEVCVRT